LGSNRGFRGVSRDLVIVLDTNMLMLIASGVNVLEQIEEKLAVKPRYVVLKPVIIELEKLASSGRPGVSKKASFALEVVRRLCEVVEADAVEEKGVDELIIEFAEKHRAVVATNDRELRRKLRERGIPEIYIREDGFRVEVEGLYI